MPHQWFDIQKSSLAKESQARDKKISKESLSHMFTNFTEWAFRKAKQQIAFALLHLKVHARLNAETSGERTRTWQRGTWSYRNIYGYFQVVLVVFKSLGASW